MCVCVCACVSVVVCGLCVATCYTASQSKMLSVPAGPKCIIAGGSKLHVTAIHKPYPFRFCKCPGQYSGCYGALLSALDLTASSLLCLCSQVSLSPVTDPTVPRPALCV